MSENKDLIFSQFDLIEQELAFIKQTIKEIKDLLGKPNEETPDPIAKAYYLADEALK